MTPTVVQPGDTLTLVLRSKQGTLRLPSRVLHVGEHFGRVDVTVRPLGGTGSRTVSLDALDWPDHERDGSLVEAIEELDAIVRHYVDEAPRGTLGKPDPNAVADTLLAEHESAHPCGIDTTSVTRKLALLVLPWTRA